MRRGLVSDVERGGAGEVDASRLFRTLLRKRFWILVPTLVALVASTLYVNLAKPRYTSEARVLLENQENFFTRADKGERGEASAPDAEAVQSQIQLITSRDLARRVIKTLDLAGNDEFDPLAKGMGALTRAMTVLGIIRDPTQRSPEERILENFADRLSVLSPTKTRVLSIEFSSRDPDLAERGANAVAQTYIDMQQEAKRANARAAAETLHALIDDMSVRAAQADAASEAFRTRAGLLIGNNNTVISAQQLGDINNQLSLSRTAQADALAKARLLRDMLRQNRIADIPDIANNEHLRRLAEQRVTLRAQLAQELRTLMPGHPRIKELQAQLAALEEAGRAAGERAARALENDARIAGARVDNLTHALDEQKKVVGAASSDEVHLRELERDAKVLKEQLEVETAKYQEALARERGRATPADARLIQRALAPQQPSFPKKLPIVTFATLAAFILSTGAIVAGQLLSGEADATAFERETANVRAPSRDFASFADNLSSRRIDEPALLAKIDALRSEFSCAGVLIIDCDEPPVLYDRVCSLARGLSRRGRAVLVADEGRDQRYERLVPALDAPAGLHDLIAGRADFAKIIHRDASSRLHVVPPGSRAGEEQHEIALVVDALSQTYDFVVFVCFSRSRALELAPQFQIAVLGDGAHCEELLADIGKVGCEAVIMGDGASALAA